MSHILGRKKILLSFAVMSIAALGLAGCASTTESISPTESTPAASESPSESESPAETTADLAVATTDLGDIVVDGKGMTVYMFTKDVQGSGESTCSGECADKWPSVIATSDEPVLDGVTGEVGTIVGVNGEKQMTLDGWPLYYWVGDAAEGDTTGQAVGGVWWVLTPAGVPIEG